MNTKRERFLLKFWNAQRIPQDPCWFHRWSIWSQPELWEGGGCSNQAKQFRICEKCQVFQERFLVLRLT